MSMKLVDWTEKHQKSQIKTSCWQTESVNAAENSDSNKSLKTVIIIDLTASITCLQCLSYHSQKWTPLWALRSSLTVSGSGTLEGGGGSCRPRGSEYDSETVCAW